MMGVNYLVVSAGMQKSGTGYLYHLIDELLQAAGNPPPQRVKVDYHFESLMQGDNQTIGRLFSWKLLRLVGAARRAGAFAVKTHSGPTPGAWMLSRMGLIKIIYSYRDPRDALLSGMDHGRRIVSKGKNHTFAEMVEFEQALKVVKRWLRVWRMYQRVPGILQVRYEDLLADPLRQVERIEKYLGLSIGSETKQAILWKYSKDNPAGEREGMHFNKAAARRYVEGLTPDQRERARKSLGAILRRMGYDPD